MAIDMRQFHETFFEESFEGLTLMEAELLHLEKAFAASPGDASVAVNPEIMNMIFRAAHSIKGGSSTFGFNDVAEFSHVLESRLDALRDGRCHPDRRMVSLLLQSVDCLRHLISAARTGKDVDPQVIQEIRVRLEALPLGESGTIVPYAPAAPQSNETRVPPARWRIVFRPQRRFFHTGNDPLRILRELAGLGALKVHADLTALPSWEEMNSEECYFVWTLELSGNVTREAIVETFDWVTEHCDLKISPLETENTIPRAAHVKERAHDKDNLAGSIRVNTPKVDALINLVGELVITQSMLGQLADNFTLESLPKFFSGLAQLERNTRDLQESVMRIRMLPLSFTFNRLPRLVRDMSHKLGKRVELHISGDQTELDKTVIERIGDPLLHLVRNCLDHGIEPPAERIAAGKPETGIIELKAYQKGGNVMIEINDDGRGIQRDRVFTKAVERGLIAADAKYTSKEIHEFIFMPGFSTAETVSDVSGRGVGMDVVRSNILSLGGSVDIVSEEGKGTRFTVRLPLTLAILDGLSVQVGEHIYILPLVNIIESICLRSDQVSRPGGGHEIFPLRQEYLPLIRLHDLFRVKPRSADLSQGVVVIIEAEGKKAGLFVDEMLGQQQVVIKSLETHYRRVEAISAATILGDGTVAMILDVSGLTRLVRAPVSGLAYHNPAGLPAAVQPPAYPAGHELRS